MSKGHKQFSLKTDIDVNRHLEDKTMTQQKSASKTSSDYSEDEVFNKEPLTQRDPDDPPTHSDDQHESPEEKPTSKNSSKQKSVTVNSIFTIEELTPDDEIFTLQCPEKFNKQDMCNKNLNFTELKPTITSENEVYQLEFITSEKKSISLAIPKKTSGSSLVNLPLKGHIVIKKVVDLPTTESEAEDMHSHDKHVVVFPTNIKLRHPLLGSDWEALTDLVNTGISKKLSKKHKKDKSLEMEPENKKLKREPSEPRTPQKKKKKKHDL